MKMQCGWEIIPTYFKVQGGVGYKMELKCWNRIVYTIDFKCTENGVPAVVQWVKNLTAEAQVGSPAWCSGLKDLALLQLQ